MKSIKIFLASTLLLAFGSLLLSAGTGINFAPTMGIVTALNIVGNIVAPITNTVAMTGLRQDLWERELINKFRFVGSWLNVIPNKNNWVNNDIINLAEIGADPNVLIDNAAYPIATAGRTDDNIPVSLKKFETENTEITSDELYALPYDKEGSVIRQHREVLEEEIAAFGLYSLAPEAVTADMPILRTSGPADGTRKRLIVADIIALKKEYDDRKIPMRGRHLVLSTEHVQDLLLVSEVFEKQYQNITDGKINNMYSFNIWEDLQEVIYTNVDVKAAFGAVQGATDRLASVAFHEKHTARARGTVEMFRRDRKLDPENRKTVVGFELRHIVTRTSDKGAAALVSGIV